jgi:hypothetical protein
MPKCGPLIKMLISAPCQAQGNFQFIEDAKELDTIPRPHSSYRLYHSRVWRMKDYQLLSKTSCPISSYTLKTVGNKFI